MPIEELKYPEIQTLEDYLQVTATIQVATRWSKKSYFLYDCIQTFEEKNPGLLAKYKFEHRLANDSELVTSKDLIPF